MASSVLKILFFLTNSVLCMSAQFHGSGDHVDRRMGIVKPKLTPCEPLEKETLEVLLGAAFNPRYMSLDAPPNDNGKVLGRPDIKRNVPSYLPFSVDDDFKHDFDEVPAWETAHSSLHMNQVGRMKRSPSQNPRPWECEATVKWIDLGRDYFPRYLRTVECTKHDCWYSKYVCKPRSFTVKILRKKSGMCAEGGLKTGFAGLPSMLRELWIWEERAVNFCCDCAQP